MKNFMYFYSTFFVVLCQRYKHQSGTHYHISGFHFRKLKTYKASLYFISSHRFQNNTFLKIILFIQRIHMGIIDFGSFL